MPWKGSRTCDIEFFNWFTFETKIVVRNYVCDVQNLHANKLLLFQNQDTNDIGDYDVGNSN
jgi:hypothetical protein